MTAWIRSIDWPDPLEAFVVGMLLIGLLVVIGLVCLLIAVGIEDADRRAHMPHELSSDDGSVPPAIITDRATGCQYLRGDWGQTTPRMNADGKQVCKGETPR